MLHPFVSGHSSVAYAQPDIEAGAIVVGADGVPVAAAPAQTSEMSTTAKVVALGLAVGFLYYLGHKNGRIEGFVRGAHEGEKLALESIQAHQAVHATAYPSVRQVVHEDEEE